MRAEAEKEPGRPMSMGVCDEAGHMICFCMIEGEGNSFSAGHGLGKQYTVNRYVSILNFSEWMSAKPAC